MLDESYLDEQTRPPLQPATMAENIESNFPILTGQMHKVYLAKVYSTLAFAFSMACIGAYAVNRNDIHPSLWWGLLQIFSLYMLFFSSTTKRWKMGRLQSTPTTNEYVLKWFFLAVFSFCSGINMGNFLEYMSKFSTVRYSFGMIGDFDKKITPDSLLVTAATFMIFAFCGLVSHTDFQFLMTCIASIGTGIVFWPTGGWLLNLTSLLKYDPGKIQLSLAIFSLFIMIESSIIENEVRDGRKDILYHSGIFLFDVFTVFSRAIFNMVMSRKTFPVAEKQRPIPAATSNEPIIIPGE